MYIIQYISYLYIRYYVLFPYIILIDNHVQLYEHIPNTHFFITYIYIYIKHVLCYIKGYIKQYIARLHKL